jgi:putative FmdB family regulatory protein
MPTYVYRCDDCDLEFEIVQSFSESKLTLCQECQKNSLYRVPQAPFCYSVGEPTTVQHLADRNTKKIGREEAQERTMISAERREKHLKKDRKVPKGATQLKPSGKTPWYRSGKMSAPASKTPLDISKLDSQEKIDNYIERGVGI